MGIIEKTYRIINANVSPSAPFEVVKELPDGKKLVKAMGKGQTGMTAVEAQNYIKDNYPELFPEIQ